VAETAGQFQKKVEANRTYVLYRSAKFDEDLLQDGVGRKFGVFCKFLVKGIELMHISRCFLAIF